MAVFFELTRRKSNSGEFARRSDYGIRADAAGALGYLAIQSLEPLVLYEDTEWLYFGAAVSLGNINPSLTYWFGRLRK